MLGLQLIAAHMVGDFILQSDHMARQKLTDPVVRFFHCVVYMIPISLVASAHEQSAWGYGAFVALNLVAHFAIDSRRWASGEKWPPKPIMVDQALHITTLALSAGMLA